MKDVDPEPGQKSQYECFECGTITMAENSPGQCPDCSGPMRNRRMPLE
jgi:rubrerythrin